MKNGLKFLLPLLVLLPLAGQPLPAKNVSKARVDALIRDVRSEGEVEVVDIGFFGMWAIRNIARFAAQTAEDETGLRFLRGLKGLRVVDFEDLAEEPKRRFADKLEKALAGCEKMMEAKSDGECVRIYAKVDEKHGCLRDMIVFDDSGTLVCLYGKFSLDMIDKVMLEYR